MTAFVWWLVGLIAGAWSTIAYLQHRMLSAHHPELVAAKNRHPSARRTVLHCTTCCAEFTCRPDQMLAAMRVHSEYHCTQETA